MKDRIKNQSLNLLQTLVNAGGAEFEEDEDFVLLLIEETIKKVVEAELINYEVNLSLDQWAQAKEETKQSPVFPAGGIAFTGGRNDVHIIERPKDLFLVCHSSSKKNEIVKLLGKASEGKTTISIKPPAIEEKSLIIPEMKVGTYTKQIKEKTRRKKWKSPYKYHK